MDIKKNLQQCIKSCSYWLVSHKSLQMVFSLVFISLSFYLAVDYWYFTWIAMFFLCLYALEESTVHTFVVGFVSYLLGSANPHAVLPLVAYWPFSTLNSIAAAIVVLIFRHIAFQWQGWGTSIVFASGFTAQEFIISLFSPHGTVNSLAYTQMSNLPIIQIGCITGIWGITFFIALISANLALFYRFPQNRSLKTNLVSIVLFIFVVLFGLYRLNLPLDGPKIKVGIAGVSTNLEQYLAVTSNRYEQQVNNTIQRYIEKADLLTNSGAEVVLFPEKIITVEAYDHSVQQLSEAARKNKIYLIVGVIRKDNSITYNSAYVFSPTGEVLLKYDKRHLHTTFESKYTSGKNLGIMDKWGIEICKDMDFIEPSLEYSQEGANIIFVPALDFHEDGWNHARVAVMRGVEGNYPVVRAGQWGFLTISDSRGRIIKKVLCDNEQDDAFLLEEVTLGQGNSIYSKIGNGFGWASLVAFIMMSIKFIVQRSNIKIRWRFR